MKYILLFLVVALAMIQQACVSIQPTKSAYTQPMDLTGEWAVEWVDKSKSKETIYIWISQHGDVLTGSALDPNLIPAVVSGKVNSGVVTFDVGPERGIGFRPPSPPVTTFKGTITGPNLMEGRYKFRWQRGLWSATQTARGANRTVFITEKTKITMPLTVEEYNRLYHPLSDPDLGRVWEPLTKDELKIRESLRVGEYIEVQEAIGGFYGWFYHMRNLAHEMRMRPETAAKERKLHEKMLKILNKNGYPWKSMPL